MLKLLVLGLLLNHAYASFCGSSAVPFSFEALPDGQPVLGCARPVCFGLNEDAQKQPGRFYRINRKPDGFIRSGDAPVTRYFQQHEVECEDTFQSFSCDADNQWVAGIAPLLKVNSSMTALQCCTYEPLRISSDRGLATVKPGQIVIGGEITTDTGEQYAFDYVSNIEKTMNVNGTVTYYVNMRRFYCPDQRDLMPQVVTIKPATSNSVQDVRRAPVAYQVPIQPAANPIPLGGSSEENVLVEEVIEQDGIQLSSTTEEPEEPLPVEPPQPVEPPLPPEPPAPQPQFVPQQEFVAEPIYFPAPAPPAIAAAPPVYYSGVGSYYCFTGDTKVRLIDGSEKRLDVLQVEDWVQTLNGAQVKYVPVSFWLHKVPSQSAEFLRIELSDGTTVKLTARHFIYKTTCTFEGQEITNATQLSREAVLAERVIEGDCLYRIMENERIYTTRVTKITKVFETGIYSPMTSNGKIVVNGIYASCHNIVQSNSLQRSFFSYAEQMRELYASFFSEPSDVAELPPGIDILTTMLDYIIPSDLVTM